MGLRSQMREELFPITVLRHPVPLQINDLNFSNRRFHRRPLQNNNFHVQFHVLMAILQGWIRGDEDVMELLWQNGQVVMQNQNQRSVGNKKPETRPLLASREIRSSVAHEETGPSDLFMKEDDLLYPTPPSSTPLTTDSRSLPPPPPPSIMIPSPCILDQWYSQVVANRRKEKDIW
ncbi:hypothetical protein LXL04_005489 [Taraxacum kok-saghyz]